MFPCGYFPQGYMPSGYFPVVCVVAQPKSGGGGPRARIARNEDEYNQLLEQIQREDEEILMIIAACVQTGVIK